MARAKSTKSKSVVPDKNQVRDSTKRNMENLLSSYDKRFKNTYSAQLASNLIGEGDILPLPIGSISFDLMTGIGGLPRGKIIEFTGEEGSHKSNAAWKAVGNVHAMNDYEFCVWIDAEKAVDLRIPMQRKHVANMGVDFNRLILVVPTSAEECWSIIIEAAQNGATLIVLDSVTALIPKKELKAGVEAEGYPALPAAINRGFRSISKELWLSGSTLIEINQVRENLDNAGANKKYIAFEDQWKTTGGKGLKHWLYLRLFFRKKAIKVLPDGADSKTPKVHIGDEVTVSVIKTRLAPKMDKAKMFMYHKTGFDVIEELINMLTDWEIIFKETPRAQKYTFIDPNDESSEAMTWDEWYELLSDDKEYYTYMCDIISDVYNTYYAEDDNISAELEEQEADDDYYEDEE